MQPWVTQKKYNYIKLQLTVIFPDNQSSDYFHNESLPVEMKKILQFIIALDVSKNSDSLIENFHIIGDIFCLECDWNGKLIIKVVDSTLWSDWTDYHLIVASLI